MCALRFTATRAGIAEPCNTATVRNWDTAILQHCNTATLQHCNTATLHQANPSRPKLPLLLSLKLPLTRFLRAVHLHAPRAADGQQLGQPQGGSPAN